MKAGRSLLLGMLLAVGGQLMGAGAYAQGDLATVGDENLAKRHEADCSY